MLGSLATFGYADKTTLWELQAAMHANPHALIIDTRFTPSCSWEPLWQRNTLQVAWEKRYIWRGDWLGNVNYNKRDAPIQLANEEQGIPWLVRGLEKGLTLILLCGCLHYETCHRKVIYDKVKERLDARLPDYSLGQRVLTAYGVGTIDPHIPLNVHRARNRYAVVLDVPNVQRYFFPSELKSYELVQSSLVA